MPDRKRQPEPEIAQYLVLDRGAFELGLPVDWEVQPQKDRQAGEIIVKDPTDSVQLDVQYWPTGLPAGLSVEGFLTALLRGGGLDLVRGPEIGDRGDMHYAWLEDVFEATDQERGQMRTAHCRWYLATNGRLTGQVRYFYWQDDASWALPVWRRIIETVQLGTGTPLSSPFEHWSIRKAD